MGFKSKSWDLLPEIWIFPSFSEVSSTETGLFDNLFTFCSIYILRTADQKKIPSDPNSSPDEPYFPGIVGPNRGKDDDAA